MDGDDGLSQKPQRVDPRPSDIPMERGKDLNVSRDDERKTIRPSDPSSWSGDFKPQRVLEPLSPPKAYAHRERPRRRRPSHHRLSPGKHTTNINSPTNTHSVHSGVSPIMAHPLRWPGSRSGWLCDRTIPQAAIGFAGVQERDRPVPVDTACLLARDTLCWLCATKTSVYPTCTRDARERLHKRKILGD